MNTMSVEGRIGSVPESHRLGIAPISASDSSSSSAISASAASLETLDEPVSTTILRDLKRVAIKLRHVLMPNNSVKELRDCK